MFGYDLTNRRAERAQNLIPEQTGPKRLASLGPSSFPRKGNDMTDAIWRNSGLPFGHAAHNIGRRKNTSLSRTAALHALGSVVYAARLADGTIKIGWTERFEDRLRYLSHYTKQDVELLAFRSGTFEDEQAIHRALNPHVIKGKREFYHPAPEVLAVVNEMREALRLPEIAA
jgi:hypothetical protein